MTKPCRFIATISALFAMIASSAYADDRDGGRNHAPIYSIAHFDVIPLNLGGVDFLQSAYSLLFKYRDQSQTDRGLQSLRVLNLIPPVINHSEVVEVWSSYDAYKDHLAQAHTVGFRFDVQGSPALGGICCIGSPIDDRQYRLVRSFKAPWTSSTIPSTVGASGALFVVTYVELLQEGNVEKGENELVGYGAATASQNGARLLSYSVLQQLDRPNRYAVLEVWSNQADYNTWQGLPTTTNFVTKIKPLLGSPLDHRLTMLCGKTFDDSAGCTPP
jgi:quinol monooxygenase YgiN